MSRIGHDFLPFYTAGAFVREGTPLSMYDLDAIRIREHQIASQSGFDLGEGFGPFWNPPFYALPFVPLSALPFRAAMLTWLGINLVALCVAMTLLCRLLASRGADWRSWGLVPLLVLASSPFLLAVTHGQNTFCSLLLLTLATLAWRSRRAVLLGVMIGLLAYKPQLAALVGVIALIDLGWKVALGSGITGVALLLFSELAMPGVLSVYSTALPKTLHFMQVEHLYMWERHATLKAFWRLLVQGYSIGETNPLVNVLTLASAGIIGVALFVAAFRSRNNSDRLIAATIAAMPLVMPFYFDYDLLLLAIPAVLVAREGQAAGRLLVSAWSVLYAWLLINPDIAERTHVNVAVPLLCVVAGVLVARALQREKETAQCEAGNAGLPPIQRLAA